MKITVAINTYNAAKHLEVVLESIKLVDEILICDMYSTDATIEIAKKYNARIISHEKVDYVEPARNFVIQNAYNDWVLLLDADETVSPELLDELLKIAKTNLYNAVSIPRKNYFMGKFMRSAFPDYNIRFFKKEAIHWPKEIHSNPEIKGKVFRIHKNKNLAMEHLADDTVESILKKTNAYTFHEINKRREKKVSFSKLIFSPLFWFIKYYLIKGGFLDGIEGFIFAKTKSHYKFYTLAKILENRNAKKNHIWRT